MDGQKDRRTDTDGQTDGQIQRVRQTDKEKRPNDREKHIGIDRQRQTQTERPVEKERQTKRER